VSMVIPSSFSRYFAPGALIREERLLNVGIVVMLLIAYGLYLWFSLATHAGEFASVEKGAGEQEHPKRWSLWRAVGTLVVASVFAALMSEVLVGAAEGAGKALGMSSTFIGIVLLAIVGGAAESGSAIAMARRNKMDLAIAIALGSSIQIALFVAPVLVLASYFLAAQPLNLSFGRAEVGSLFLGVLLGALVCGDGQSNWYRGVQLVTIYFMVALMFLLMPDAVR
jgi:Ca2+:H+ antiporter